jgi:mono/diheme cytochrome c family protein
LDKITDLNWKWSDNPTANAEMQRVNGKKFMDDWRVQSLQNCSACHR